MKWSDQQRGHGFHRRDNGAFRRDNEGGFSRRNCRGIWWRGLVRPCFWGPVFESWRKKSSGKFLEKGKEEEEKAAEDALVVASSSLGLVLLNPYL